MRIRLWQNKRQQSVNDFSSCKSGNWNLNLSLLSIIIVLATCLGKIECYTLLAPSWQWASTKWQCFTSWLLGNLGGKWSHTSINNGLVAFIRWEPRRHPATASLIIAINWVFHPATQWWSTFQPIKPVKTPYIDISSHLVLSLTILQGQKSLTLRWRSFSTSGRERVAFILACTGGQYISYA